MGSKKISDLGEAKSTRFMEFGRKVSAMAARYKRDISVVIVELRESATTEDDTLAILQATGSKTMRECDYIAAYGDRGFIFILPETPPLGAEAFVGRLQQGLSDNFPAVVFGVTGWSPSAVAPGILSLLSSATEALDSAYSGDGASAGLAVRMA